MDNGRLPEHHIGSIANSTSHTIQEAFTVDVQTNQYSSCPKTLCLYTDPQGCECLEPINCGTAPDHFKNKHGIRNMGREVELICVWQNCGCRVIRHNYIRHIREHHLQHDRVFAHTNQHVIHLN
ncbi:hypothetical protein BKA82DRAFT_1008842 [Pisolithus tinctorius]|uniref:Uncharacterized protein n=1 Tax=Pisolithus tinctorius Marx 270 TaxID=870435 RepID=A0A0C3NDD4_PISTI|nr:hypothetical protein BKA82DRAFT_1008842 [Pisolithus tinctorius]KIN93593.1 hypothetical protein M404DRAFT_1008842 [Pisolithus tinctorius Marx 270]